MRSTDLDVPVFNWNTLLNTMNYGIVGEYLTWLQENWEDLTNIDDHYYWRAKMNPGEKEMSKTCESQWKLAPTENPRPKGDISEGNVFISGKKRSPFG